VSDEEGKQDPHGQETDEQLMAAFARGSTDAFSTLFARYRQPMFGFFWRRIADRPEAEELTQETFLALFKAQGRYEATASFRTYLYAIAIRILRAHRRKATFRAMFLGALPLDQEPETRTEIDSEITLREAVGKLDRAAREILMLREYEELSYVEIAALLHIPVNTVRSRLFRARTVLREMLATPAAGAGQREFSKMEGRA
jgi:RNA polymerase sigma factor (sigma-70 family)